MWRGFTLNLGRMLRSLPAISEVERSLELHRRAQEFIRRSLRQRTWRTIEVFPGDRVLFVFKTPSRLEWREGVVHSTTASHVVLSPIVPGAIKAQIAPEDIVQRMPPSPSPAALRRAQRGSVEQNQIADSESEEQAPFHPRSRAVGESADVPEGVQEKAPRPPQAAHEAQDEEEDFGFGSNDPLEPNSEQGRQKDGRETRQDQERDFGAFYRPRPRCPPTGHDTRSSPPGQPT